MPHKSYTKKNKNVEKPRFLFKPAKPGYRYIILPPIPNVSKVWTKCGVTQAYQTLFPNVFFYWFYRARAQSAEPVSFSSHIKKFVPPQHKLLVFTTPTLELRSNAFPSAGGTCPVLRVPLWGRNARISTFRRERSWSGIYSAAARAVGGAGVELIFGDYANPGLSLIHI